MYCTTAHEKRKIDSQPFETSGSMCITHLISFQFLRSALSYESEWPRIARHIHISTLQLCIWLLLLWLSAICFLFKVRVSSLLCRTKLMSYPNWPFKARDSNPILSNEQNVTVHTCNLMPIIISVWWHHSQVARMSLRCWPLHSVAADDRIQCYLGVTYTVAQKMVARYTHQSENIHTNRNIYRWERLVPSTLDFAIRQEKRCSSKIVNMYVGVDEENIYIKWKCIHAINVRI